MAKEPDAKKRAKEPVQQALPTDGLMPPFWAKIGRHGHVFTKEEDELSWLLSSCYHGEEAGDHFVQEIGDQEGLLWERRPAYDFTWEAKDERAPWPTPYERWGE